MNVLAIAFINVLLLKDSLQINVALNASTKSCVHTDLPGRLVDGIISKEFPEPLTATPCVAQDVIDIFTSKHYFIHYFMVYRAQGPELNQMAYFASQVYDIDKADFSRCTEYNLKVIPFDKGVRMNCVPHPKSNQFRIYSRINKGLYISEIELHYIGINPENVWSVHKGCYSSFEGTLKTEIIAIDECAKGCQPTHLFFAMKKQECYCSNNYSEIDEVQSCSTICDNTGRMCGGDSLYSVYAVNVALPRYLGCYMQTVPLTGHNLTGNMSIGKCVKFCESKKLALLSQGNMCHCANLKEEGEHTPKREECEKPCSGETNRMCGAEDPTRYSIYLTCFNPETLSSKCSQWIMCGSYNEFGICQEQCKYGFTGEHCLEKTSRPYSFRRHLSWNIKYFLIPFCLTIFVVALYIICLNITKGK